MSIFSQPALPPVQVGLEVGGGTLLHSVWANVFQSFYRVLSARGFPCEIETAAGAIGIKDGTSILIGTGALAMTIVVPTQGPLSGSPPLQNGDDMKTLLIYSTTAFAHTVTGPTNCFNGNKHIATWAAAVGNFLRIFAYNGIWYVVDSNGVTLS
jgi:hypothetical protein